MRGEDERERGRDGIERRTITRATVVGCGTIGSGVAATLLAAGIKVSMVGVDADDTRRGIEAVSRNLDDLLEACVLTGATERAHAAEALSTETEPAPALADAELVLEAVFEDLAVKQEVFAAVEAHAPKEAILCSSTSGLSPNRIAEHIDPASRQSHMLVTHFWNPPHLVPLVEVVPHDGLEDGVRERALALLRRLGKAPVVLKKDVPGHIGNRLQHALYREALHLIEEGAASPEDIDTVVLQSLGPRFARIGPMEYFDSVGFDLHRQVQSYLYPSLCNAPEPQRIIVRKIEDDQLGAKSGQGLYPWSPEAVESFHRRKNAAFIELLKQRRG
jgi:3-hydroxybutyryl-CoA dehydrogenase